MEVQLLRTFVTVARLGSFSAAASELGYTQAAVSQQIAALENDLKTQLLNRRPVVPTEAGARLLEHAEPILLRLDAARADVTRMTSTPAATLIVGVTPLAGATPAPALAAALAELRERMPRLDISVRTGTRVEVAFGVARGELDIALTDGLTAPGDPLPELAPVAATGVSQAGVAVILPAGHPLAGRRALRLPDLADSRWIEAEQVAPPLAEIRQARRRRRLSARVRLRGIRHTDSDQARGSRPRSDPATATGAIPRTGRVGRHHRGSGDSPTGRPPHRADPRHPPRILPSRRASRHPLRPLTSP